MNFNDPNFLDKISTNAGSIIKQIKSKVLNNSKFRILKSNYLDKFWIKRPNKNNVFTLYITEEKLDELDFQVIEENLNEKIIKEVLRSNFIEVDSCFNVLKSERLPIKDSREVKKLFKEKSEENYVVFFFGNLGIDVFVKGENATEVNFFYSTEDLERFYEKKDISQIKEVLTTYQNQYLKKQVEYSRFFIDKGTINKLKLSSNILVNKPEKLMRDHLRNFLSERMRHTFKIEIELESSKKELDIYTEVDGEFYFFEIKWLGKSINANRDNISVTYTDSRAREGVTQSLEYISELIEIMGINVKAGYLIVFDARDTKVEIDFKNFTYIDADLKKYLDIFDVMPRLELTNIHPT